MDSETARSLLEYLACGATGLWVAGAWFTTSTARQLGMEAREELAVAAPGAAVTRRVAEVVAKSIRGMPLQSCRLESATPEAVRWRSEGPLRYVAELSATADGKQSRVTLSVVASSPLLWVARAVVVVGALVTGGLYYALSQYVATSADEGVRWQVVQMVQAVHLLWPPFLLAGLPRMMRRRVMEEVRRVVQNTPFA